MLRIDDFSYDLPSELIAREPARPRDAARMMVFDREEKTVKHLRVSQLHDLIDENWVVVINQTKVFPARLIGKKESGGEVEVLLIQETDEGGWEALSKPGLKEGTEVVFSDTLKGLVKESNNQEGVLKIEFNYKGEKLKKMIEENGLVPIPPYIKTTATQKQLKQDYQTVFANDWGSAAAPTAGLHFTKTSIRHMADAGVGVIPITLHVGLGTFQPVTQTQIATNKLHMERFNITKQAAEKIIKAKEKGKKILAIGTTVARALESAAMMDRGVMSLESGWLTTNLFIQPPYKFKVIDSLLTNFHLPESSLLMLVAAFGAKPNGRETFSTFKTSWLGELYRMAIEEKYRFYSFGDCMWIR